MRFLKLVCTICPVVAVFVHPLIGLYLAIGGVGMLHVIYKKELEELKEKQL